MNVNKKGILALISTGILSLATPTILSFLAKWEGSNHYTVYADKLAGGLPTVCKGITKYTSPYPVIVGEKWSASKCKEVEQYVITNTQLELAKCITNKNIKQPTFEALTSLAHNVGVSATCKSKAVNLINKGDIYNGCDAIAHTPNGNPNWSYVNKVFIKGLYNRRLEERKLCLQGL